MSTNGTKVYDYTSVRVVASTVSFIILAFFNLIINWSILRDERLRSQARFVLVFHLLFSALVYFGVCCAFYLQIQIGARTPAAVCQAVITILITSASNILLTLTAMALDRYFAICFPLKYSSTCCVQWPWLVGLLTWGLALVTPLSLLAKTEGVLVRERCGREQLKKGEFHKITLISLCALLILFSYCRILQESRRLGVLNRRNRVGCRTIAMHGAQLAVYIVPNFVNFVLHILQKYGYLNPGPKEQFGVINFAFFSLAQCIAPIVYGLRKEELLEQLYNRFPCLSCHFKSVLEWTVRATQPRIRPQARERVMTSQRLMSIDLPRTAV
ncbi:hypothetical protein AAFF_G00325120 [Aldrovandia affinis]|uniref:G-protein coupled receptors family 1 profile domain-containing protein n=1 Tax=Aldrovandia affinis TaxID=143900 RepID=A0AAD7T918_9TELE|nr:hypothetical protein AAFF_G00325120 [Aldrovandia affinis]